MLSSCSLVHVTLATSALVLLKQELLANSL